MDDPFAAIFEAKYEWLRQGEAPPKEIAVTPDFYTRLKANTTAAQIDPRNAELLPVFSMTVVIDPELKGCEWELRPNPHTR